MIAHAPVVAVTLRGLLDRRRFWLMVGLAAVPVLIVLAATLLADARLTADEFDLLVVRTVLPLIALVFGTGALGTEIDDGTIVYLLTKPIRRSRIIIVKGLVAAGLTAALVVPATLLAGAIGSGDQTVLRATIAYAIAVAIGGSAYALAFMALSAFTSRALLAGLGYVLVWEGILGGLLPGVQLFSIRQATLGVAAGLADSNPRDTLDPTTSALVLTLVIIGALALGSWRLARYQLRGGD